MSSRAFAPAAPSRRQALLATLLALVACAGLLAGGCSSGAPSEPAVAPEAPAAADDPYATGIHHATIEVEGYGTIEVTLNANAAPLTVANFCHLVEEGFYDGLTFHRIIEGFMVQGGDPEGNGTGGSGQTIKGEFAANGVENAIPHVRGTVSMARSNDYDSASSQFFIMQETTESLDGQYAAFGTVTSGMEVVDALCEGVPTEDSNGTVAPENQPTIARIALVD